MLDLTIKSEPQFFIIYKKRNSGINYSQIDSGIRQNLRKNILLEQKSQCFYCEKKIEDNMDKIHIDHVKQQSAYQNLSCEYKNMVISCNGNGEKHCGKYKDKNGKWDDEKYIRLIPDNPLLAENPSDSFKFISNGKIAPKTSLDEDKKSRAQNTIEYLNLNDNNLVKSRKAVILNITTYNNQGYAIDEIFKYFGEFESLFK